MKILSHKYDGDGQIVELIYKKLFFKFKLNLVGKIQLKNVLMVSFRC